MPASLASRPMPAFLVNWASRLPHQSFRGLLGVRSRYRPHGRWAAQGGPLSSECFSRCRYLHRPLRLLPAGATVAGRDSHPLRNGAFARRTNRVELSAERRGGVERTRQAAVHDVADQAGDENRHEDIAVPHEGQPDENGNPRQCAARSGRWAGARASGRLGHPHEILKRHLFYTLGARELGQAHFVPGAPALTRRAVAPLRPQPASATPAVTQAPGQPRLEIRERNLQARHAGVEVGAGDELASGGMTPGSLPPSASKLSGGISLVRVRLRFPAAVAAAVRPGGSPSRRSAGPIAPHRARPRRCAWQLPRGVSERPLRGTSPRGPPGKPARCS